jgi:hypothetical protein
MHVGDSPHFSPVVQNVLSSTYHDRWIGREGLYEYPPRLPDFSPLHFFHWGHLNTLPHAAPVDNEEAFHHRIVDARQTIRSYLGIFVWIRRSVILCDKTWVEPYAGQFAYVL